MLIVTPHPVIGAGIETVLGLEDLYDLRRVATLADAAEAAASWPADAALVDGMLLEGRAIDLGIPSYVLSGDAESGERLAERLPGARGWLFKDASRGKANFVTLLGVDAARQRLGLLKTQTKSHLDPFGARADFLRASVDFVLERRQ